MLGYDPQCVRNVSAMCPQSGLAVGEERYRGPEAQVEVLQGQLDQKQNRGKGPVGELKAAQERPDTRWRC